MSSKQQPNRPQQSREDIIRQVEAEASITDVRVLRREALLIGVLSREDLSERLDLNRRRRIRPLGAYLASLIKTASPGSAMMAFAEEIANAALLRTEDLPRFPELIVEALFFTDPDGGRLTRLFKVIMGDPELLRITLRAVDAQVEAESRANLREIEEAERRAEAWGRKKVVLVGDGPITSLVGSILGLFFNVVVVTEQRRVAKRWRNRPIFLNSSCAIADPDGAPLPLLGGPTTQVVGPGLPAGILLNSDVLLNGDVLEVECDDGSFVAYPSGLELGALAALDTLFSVDTYLVGQRVALDQIVVNADSSLRLMLIDTEVQTRRVLDGVEAVFLLTGPGGERTRVSSPESQALYETSSRKLAGEIRQARARLVVLRNLLEGLEAQPETLGVLSLRQATRELIAEVTVSIPRVLTLGTIEEVYDIWQHDLGHDPDRFPLAPLFNAVTIAYVGDGDTMRTVKELLEMRGPRGAYPKGLIYRPGKSIIYNEETSTGEEYDAANRRRYRGTVSKGTSTVPYKVLRYRLRNTLGGKPIEIQHRGADGAISRRLADYLVDCTGLDRTAVETELSIPLEDLHDLEGVTVGRGNEDAGLYVLGSATGETFPFPPEIQRIIELLGIAQNPLALWAQGCLAGRAAWHFAGTHPHHRRGGTSS